MPKTVLVVEDDFDTQQPMAELLRLKGYTVNTASNAELAFEMARRIKPDLIITDIVLPGKSGLHFITSVRGDDPIKSTPIIVISGCGPMMLVEAESAGANCCLEKPIHIESFWAALEQFFGRLSAFQTDSAVEQPEDKSRVLAIEIDELVEELRQTASKDEKADVLKRLKERIRQLQARNTHFA